MTLATYRLTEARAAFHMWKAGKYTARYLLKILKDLECDVDFRESDTGPYVHVQERKSGSYFEMNI